MAALTRLPLAVAISDGKAMVFSIGPAAMALGFMLGNVLICLIPPARRVLDAEARGYPGTSFVESMRGLLKICLWALPIGFAVALTAAYLLTSSMRCWR